MTPGSDLILGLIPADFPVIRLTLGVAFSIAAIWMILRAEGARQHLADQTSHTPIPNYETIHLQGPLARTSASLDECASLLRSVIGPLQRLTDDQQRALAMLERLHERIDPAALREHIMKVSREDKHAVINAIQPELGKTDLMIREMEDLLRSLHAENRPIFEKISEVLIRLEERGRRSR